MLLKQGMQGPDVLNLELVIQALGFQGFNAADGVYDEKTANVVRYIQKSHGLDPDGKAGPQTLALIDKLWQPEIVNFAPEPTPVITPLPSGKFPKGDEELERVHPKFAPMILGVIDLAAQEGYNLTVTRGLASFAEQHALFLKRPRVTKADAGQSYHNYGVAADIAFIVNGQISWDDNLYRNVGRWASRIGLEWGGHWHFVDKPHLQLPNMPAVAVMRAAYDQGGIPNVWGKVVSKFV
jgi:LAS superfamily LD-carboxypeptidase LdcB